MRRCIAFVIAALACGIPYTGSGCEPIVPLYRLLAGATLAGPAILTQSVPWLAIAVLIKCGAFIIFERRLSWGRAVLFMALANVLSTIPGILLAAFTGSGTGMGLVLALPLVFVLGWMVRRRIALLPGSNRFARISGGAAMISFILFLFASGALYWAADGVLNNRSYAAYWILKFLFVTLVACTGIIISAMLEESVIARFSRKHLGNVSFYPSVFRANYITLGIVLLFAALEMLPKRLHSPHFITSWIHSVLKLVG